MSDLKLKYSLVQKELRLSVFFLGAFLFMLPLQSAFAQTATVVVGGNGTVQEDVSAGANTATAASSAGLLAQSILHWVQEQLEWQQLNGGLGTLHGDFRLLTHAHAKVAGGTSKAIIDQGDRTGKVISLSEAAVKAVVPLTTGTCSTTYAGAMGQSAKKAASDITNIFAQVSAQSNTGTKSVGRSAAAAGILCRRIGNGWSFLPTNPTANGTDDPINATLQQTCKQTSQ